MNSMFSLFWQVHSKAEIDLFINFLVWPLQYAETPIWTCFASENIEKKPPLEVGYFSKIAVLPKPQLKNSKAM